MFSALLIAPVSAFRQAMIGLVKSRRLCLRLSMQCWSQGLKRAWSHGSLVWIEGMARQGERIF